MKHLVSEWEIVFVFEASKQLLFEFMLMSLVIPAIFIPGFKRVL